MVVEWWQMCISKPSDSGKGFTMICTKVKVVLKNQIC